MRMAAGVRSESFRQQKMVKTSHTGVRPHRAKPPSLERGWGSSLETAHFPASHNSATGTRTHGNWTNAQKHFPTKPQASPCRQRTARTWA